MDPRRLARAFPFVLLATLAAAAVASEEGEHARGRFESSSANLVVTDAYAFRAESALGEERVIQVAVSNQGFVGEVIDEHWDRRYLLDHFFRDDETGLVYFEFGEDGSYRGLSYYFGPGDGCGYCSGGVTSTVRRTGERLVGQLKQAATGEDERSFDITLDVPIASDDHGAAQGAGGGVPGQAYAAYHRALVAADRAALRERLSAERRETWEGAEKQGQGDAFLAFLAAEHPQQLTVTEAYVKGDRALVLFAGEGAIGKVKGEALLSREEGSWRFEEETVQVVLD